MLELIEDLGMMYPTENSNYKVRYGIYKCECGIYKDLDKFTHTEYFFSLYL